MFPLPFLLLLKARGPRTTRTDEAAGSAGAGRGPGYRSRVRAAGTDGGVGSRLHGAPTNPGFLIITFGVIGAKGAWRPPHLASQSWGGSSGLL